MDFVPQLVWNRKVELIKLRVIIKYFLLDQHPALPSKVEDEKSDDGENGAVVFYDEIPLILEHPK